MGFSAGLADCRAFELVTPNFQNGVNKVTLVAATADGGRLILTSLGSFGGTESNSIGVTYEVNRSATRWETAAIEPSAARFPASQYYAVSTDLGKSLWALRSSTQSIYSQDLYLREPDGTFVKVGSMVPPSSQTGPPGNTSQLFLGDYSFAGASSDLSHLYFSILSGGFESAVWPGDTTASFQSGQFASSLYEYVGVGNTTPKLVGLNGQGHLISDCGTYLGSEESRDVYNAVSGDGSRTFFTAEGHSSTLGCKEETAAPAVTEVYARLNGSESVPISEPVASDCTECLTATRAPASFQGASADGSKVFFTTTQELLPGNETENLYEFDFNASRGKRVVQVSRGLAAAEVQGVARVSQDGSHVYFVAGGRLTDEPRGGPGGECLAGESPTERAEEEEAEAKKEELGGRCRAKVGGHNLYVYERDEANQAGRLAFVASLSEGDASDWQGPDSRPAQATPDGRDLVFNSGGDLTPEVAGEGPQVYEYDAQSEELVWVSRGQSGFAPGNANANGSFALITPQTYEFHFQPAEASAFLAVSSDGSLVSFVSPAVLTAGAAEAGEHSASGIYEYRSTGRISTGDVFLLSSGHNPFSARPQTLGASGKDVFFSTSDQLVPVDTNTGFDLYDSRLDGGFESHEAPSCTGEGCLEPLGASPAPPAAPGTLSTQPEPPLQAAVPAPAPIVHPKPVSGLTKALRACRHKRRGKARVHCERTARKRFAHKSQAKRAATAPANSKVRGKR